MPLSGGSPGGMLSLNTSEYWVRRAWIRSGGTRPGAGGVSGVGVGVGVGAAGGRGAELVMGEGTEVMGFGTAGCGRAVLGVGGKTEVLAASKGVVAGVRNLAAVW